MEHHTPQGQRPLHATWVLLTGQLRLLLRGRVGSTAIWFRMGMSCSLQLLLGVLVIGWPAEWPAAGAAWSGDSRCHLSAFLRVCLVEGGSVDKSQHGVRPLLGCKESDLGEGFFTLDLGPSLVIFPCPGLPRILSPDSHGAGNIP